MTLQLDASLVVVPFESLKRVTRERKYVIEDLEGMLGALAATAGGGEEPASTTAAAAAAALEKCLQQLQGLKRKVGIHGAGTVAHSHLLCRQSPTIRLRPTLSHARSAACPPACPPAVALA